MNEEQNIPATLDLRIELNESAKKMLEELSDQRGMTQVAMMSRLWEFFALQDEQIQMMMVCQFPGKPQGDIAAQSHPAIVPFAPCSKCGRKKRKPRRIDPAARCRECGLMLPRPKTPKPASVAAPVAVPEPIPSPVPIQSPVAPEVVAAPVPIPEPVEKPKEIPPKGLATSWKDRAWMMLSMLTDALDGDRRKAADFMRTFASCRLDFPSLKQIELTLTEEMILRRLDTDDSTEARKRLKRFLGGDMKLVTATWKRYRVPPANFKGVR